MLNFRDYLEYAEKYLRNAQKEIESSHDVNWLLIPAAILAWTAIESFVNNRLDEYGSLPEKLFELHERAFLLERRIRFNDSGDNMGTFSLKGDEYRRLEDKIIFLIAKFSTRKERNPKGESLWKNFQDFKFVRDGLLHPKREREINLSIDKVETYIRTAKQIIKLVSEHIWHKKVVF